MGKIVLQGLEFHARHGLHPEEEKLGTRFIVDVEMQTPFEGIADRLEQTTDYAAVYMAVREVATGRRYYLIETLADHLAEILLERFPSIQGLTVRVHKPFAPLPGVFRDVYVETSRKQKRGGSRVEGQGSRAKNSRKQRRV